MEEETEVGQEVMDEAGSVVAVSPEEDVVTVLQGTQAQT